MPRMPRKRSESDIYHVFVRGVGRQIIFDDDDDCEFFLALLQKKMEGLDGKVLAWCLMGNHFHILFKMDLSAVSEYMKRVEVAYARYFNDRHDRMGCLFQGRFGSEPIEDDAQLLAAVRYIHMNPQKAAIAPYLDYPWSSYTEYVTGAKLIDASLVLEMCQGEDGFKALHEQDSPPVPFMEESSDYGAPKPHRMSDREAVKYFEQRYGKGWHEGITAACKAERNAILRCAKDDGMTIPQLSRLTGLGRGTIQRA